MSKSRTIEVVIKNKLGLHARPAAILVKFATSFESEITIEKDGEKINAKSLIGLLMLAADYESLLTITATGNDAYEALEAIDNLMNNDKHFLED